MGTMDGVVLFNLGQFETSFWCRSLSLCVSLRNSNQHAFYLPPEATPEARVQTFYNSADRVWRRRRDFDDFDGWRIWLLLLFTCLLEDWIHNIDMMALGSTTSWHGCFFILGHGEGHRLQMTPPRDRPERRLSTASRASGTAGCSVGTFGWLNSLIHWYTGRLYFAFWNRDVNSLALTTSNRRTEEGRVSLEERMLETRRNCGESSVPWQRWCPIHILQEGHTTSARWLMLLPQQKARNLRPSRSSKTKNKWLQPMRRNHGPSMLKAYNLQKNTVLQ